MSGICRCHLSSDLHEPFPPAWRQNGFSLLELLVVVFIIGLISGLAILSVNSSDDSRLAERETQRMRQLFTLAAQEAVLQGRPLGVELGETGYRFLIAGRTKWELFADDDLLRPRNLPQGWRVELTASSATGGNSGHPDSDTDPVPQIVFFSTGEISPFEVLVQHEQNKSRYRLQVLADGRVSVMPEGSSL